MDTRRGPGERLLSQVVMVNLTETLKFRHYLLFHLLWSLVCAVGKSMAIRSLYKWFMYLLIVVVIHVLPILLIECTDLF